MEFTKLHQRLVERTNPAGLLSPVAYDPDNYSFYCEEGALGCVFRCYPLISANEAKITQLQVLFQGDYPPGTLMQISLWAGPDIERTTYLMKALRKEKEGEHVGEGRRIANAICNRRAEYLKRHTESPISERTNTQVRDIWVFVSVKIPCRSRIPNDKDIDTYTRTWRTTKSILETIGMAPEPLDPEKYIRALGSIVNWDENASWRNPAPIYDENFLVRDQIFDTESPVEVKNGGRGLLLSGRKHVKTLSVKRLPEYVHLAQAAQYLGDARTGQRGVRHNILITTNILFPDAEESRTVVGAKKTASTWQSMGPLAKYVPRLHLQKNSFDAMAEALEDGDRVVKAYTSFCLFADSEDAVDQASGNLITYYREIGYRLQEDEFIALPIFLNALPLCAEEAAAKNLARYRTMATRHVTQMLPVIADWKGTGSPVLTLLSRNGQLTGVDLFDSDTNFSAVVAAESGSGKSFFVNFLVVNYMSLGADIYLIEVGRSFKNLCEVLHGEHMEFEQDSSLSLNPFSSIVDYEDQADLLVAVLLSMISPKGQITELQEAQLRVIAKQLWDEHKANASIDQLAERLKAYRDEDDNVDLRVNDMGVQLTPFTSAGEYGRWFQGDATIHFDKSFTVLELEELRQHPHLMKVVLVQLIAIIQRSMYLGDPGRLKLLIVDEGWDLITSGAEGRFIERGVRQLRKYRGGAILILQSVNDLYKTEVGEAIAENTANKFLLGQTPEAVDSLIATNRLSLGEGAGDLIKTVHTHKGEYSEIFVYTRRGGGVSRLIVDRSSQLLYSTDPKDKVALKQRLDRGMNLEDAIQDIIDVEERSKRRRAV